MLLACDFQPVHGDNLPDPRGTPLLNAPRTGHNESQQSGARGGSCAIVKEESSYRHFDAKTRSCLNSTLPPNASLKSVYNAFMNPSHAHSSRSHIGQLRCKYFCIMYIAQKYLLVSISAVAYTWLFHELYYLQNCYVYNASIWNNA